MNTAEPAQLLNQIVQIHRMERGKLTVMRQGPEGPYYKLQAWEDGRNSSRYVSRDQAAAVQEAVEGYHRFRELTEQYAQAIIDRTRAELAAQSKKKPYRLRRTSSWRRSRKSSN
jgi:Ser/Thr protein kinase RdoA (MazF antagonist)